MTKAPNAKSLALKKRLEEVISPVTSELGFDLIELQFIDARRPVVRLFIDSDSGVALDDCATVSRVVGERLDLLDVLTGPYHLEVSSPGIERPFASLKQYLRSVNKPVEILLEEPLLKKREYRGVLVAADEQRVLLKVGETETVEIPTSLIKRANRLVAWKA